MLSLMIVVSVIVLARTSLTPFVQGVTSIVLAVRYGYSLLIITSTP